MIFESKDKQNKSGKHGPDEIVQTRDTALSVFLMQLYPQFYDILFAGLSNVVITKPHEMIDGKKQVMMMNTFKSLLPHAPGIQPSKASEVVPNPGTKVKPPAKESANNLDLDKGKEQVSTPPKTLPEDNHQNKHPTPPVASTTTPISTVMQVVEGLREQIKSAPPKSIETAMRLPDSSDVESKIPGGGSGIPHK